MQDLAQLQQTNLDLNLCIRQAEEGLMIGTTSDRAAAEARPAAESSPPSAAESWRAQGGGPSLVRHWRSSSWALCPLCCCHITSTGLAAHRMSLPPCDATCSSAHHINLKLAYGCDYRGAVHWWERQRVQRWPRGAALIRGWSWSCPWCAPLALLEGRPPSYPAR